jgi:hypothetical protein
MSVDSSLVGAWTRHRLIVDGVRVTDQSEVLWLQTGDCYADIRVPGSVHSIRSGGPEAVFARPAAFAGTAFWHPPVMIWQHQLDSLRDQTIESSPLHFEGDVLVESGSLRWAGLTIPFREEWRRLSGRHDDMAVRADGNRMDITIGRWRIEVADDGPPGGFRACRYDREDGSWRLKGTIVEAPMRPAHGSSEVSAIWS